MTDNRPQMKPWIAQIHAYVPGRSTGADGRSLVKLSANENPLGCSPKVHEALAGQRPHHLYPDPDATALREAIGALHAIDQSRIVCGTGSGECLHGAVQAFAGPGDEVVCSRYSFSLYPLLAHKVGARIVYADPRDYAADVDNLIACVTDRTRVVLLDNPNNPVGSFLPRREVARLHAALPSDVLLIIDQAYAEYLDEDADDGGMDLAAAHDNVLVTRTFAKAYGIAGERVGWATGAPHLIAALNRLRGAFNVTSGGQKAALAALSDQDFVTRSKASNRTARAQFVSAVESLGNHGLRALPSEGNFVLVLCEGALTAGAALDALAHGGYAVRHLPSQGLPEALRITIGTQEQMDDVAHILRAAAQAA